MPNFQWKKTQHFPAISSPIQQITKLCVQFKHVSSQDMHTLDGEICSHTLANMLTLLVKQSLTKNCTILQYLPAAAFVRLREVAVNLAPAVQMPH